VPFDGSSPGTPVGPGGPCVSAAWSPDGKWMYFAAYANHHSHLWRQSYPDGVPQQLTFGPTDEETVATSPDGRSLLTSLGQARSELWLHDASGERALTTQGKVTTPWLSADARRVYFLTVRNSADPWSLARLEIASGRLDVLPTGVAVDGFDISHDERQVVYTTTQGGASEIWIAPLDRHEPPRLVVRGGDEVAFDREGRVYFRHLGESANYLHRVRPDGQGDERVLDAPILEFNAVSPDGNWVVVDLPIADSLAGAFLTPVHGGTPRMITDGWWPSRWSRDGRMFYLEVGEAGNPRREGRTAVLPFGADGSSIDFAGAASAAAALIPHAEQELSVGSDPAEYVYVRRENRRNIFRIPIH
jgi:eukaryotic-like serine/threonine-protein kinase